MSIFLEKKKKEKNGPGHEVYISEEDSIFLDLNRYKLCWTGAKYEELIKV